MKHVFISYVRENASEVQRLTDRLTAHGIKVWLDRNDIAPGVRWQQAIRRGIRDGAYFIACFSQEYNERSVTYMNEELTLAIDVLRQRPTDQSWFIPVKLNECEIPDRDIGGGDTLRSIQWLDLYRNWDSSMRRIIEVIKPTPPEIQKLLEAMTSDDEDVRLIAVRALGQYGEQGIPALTDALGDEQLRGAAIPALEAMGIHAVAALLDVLKRHKREEVRVGAAFTLGKIAAPGTGPAMVEGLRDPSDKVSAVVGQVLGQVADDETVQLLFRAVGEADEKVSRAAQHALWKVGERAVPALIKGLDSEHYERFMSVLQLIGEPSVLPLIEALHDDRRNIQAALILGRIGDDRAVAPLKQILVDGNDLIRHFAAEALKKIGTAEAICAIREYKGNNRDAGG